MTTVLDADGDTDADADVKPDAEAERAGHDGAMTSAPQPAASDDRDWTFVLEAGCPECGYRLHDPVTTSERLRAAAASWGGVLQRPAVDERPQPDVWSPLEYACHSRDLIRVLGDRVEAILREDLPTFADFDGEAEAVELQYWAQDPTAVAQEIASRTEVTVATLERVDDWERAGLRGDGRRFTVGQLCQYLLHDVEHHLHDVAG